MLPKLLINFSLTQKLFLTKTYVKSPFFIKLTILSLPNLSYNFLTELHTFLPINNFNKKNLPNISLKTFDNYSFILNSIGLIFPLKFSYKNYKLNLYIIKKKLYTFLRINEYKMHIFNIKKKSMLYKIFFFREKRNAPSYNDYLYNFFKKEVNIGGTNPYVLDSIFKKSSFFVDTNRKNINNFFNEVKINRVRFRPGYQRL
jgi:hypothetical protein